MQVKCIHSRYYNRLHKTLVLLFVIICLVFCITIQGDQFIYDNSSYCTVWYSFLWVEVGKASQYICFAFIFYYFHLSLSMLPRPVSSYLRYPKVLKKNGLLFTKHLYPYSWLSNLNNNKNWALTDKCLWKIFFCNFPFGLLLHTWPKTDIDEYKYIQNIQVYNYVLL